jgi:cellulose synthase/poly-beta-1,6-N-acetylglucosamine synthase-like glycosyltransferase
VRPRSTSVLSVPVLLAAIGSALLLGAGPSHAAPVPVSVTAPVASVHIGSVPTASALVVPAQRAPSDGGQLLPPAAPQPAPASPAGTPASAGTASEGGGTSLLGWIGTGVLVLLALLMTAVASTTLWWMLHAWKTPETLRSTSFRRRDHVPSRSFSLLVPARHEEAVLGQTLDSLAEIDHPDFEVLAIIGHDDPGTETVARAAAARHPGVVRVVIDSNVPKNKPKALNTALLECRGDVVGVFDAEDDVHPDLLRLVDMRFADTGADVVQGGVQLMNIHSSWWSMRNCLEYYFWFRSRLHFQAAQNFIPLGGNTVFMRTALLREYDGWDETCLAEDCEIGVRLSTAGAKVAVAYDPEVVTREETPDTIASLVKQRTRWDQGFLQVLGKGVWKQIPSRRARWLARYTLAMPFLQAFTGVMIPISLVIMLTAKVPTAITLLTFLPVVPTLITVAVEMAGLDDFARSFGLKARARDYVKLVLGVFPYQVLLAFAALRSVWRQLRGENSWEKTAHSNLHRTVVAVNDKTLVDTEPGTGALLPVGGAR